MKTVSALLLTVILWCAAEGLSASESNSTSTFWSYDVTVGQLLNGNNLPDGDIVRMTDEEDACIPWDQVEVIIQLVNPITWWKAFRLHSHSNTGYYRVVVEIQDNQPPVWARFRTAEMLTNHVVLWKAKTFGTETAVYRVVDAVDNLHGGHRYTLNWLDD